MKGKITGVLIDDVDLHSPFNQRYNWCLANLGPGLESPPRWEPIGIGNPKFRFRDPKDEMWFKLRWGA
jgi:hypothetical protein